MNRILKQLTNDIFKENLETIAPNYSKNVLSDDDVTKIIDKIASDIGVTKQDALAGIMLLMLKGAASGGTPQTLSVDLRGGKVLTKRNILLAYVAVTNNTYIRRLAESLAINIGEFAERFGLCGELAQRINTSLKAETGEVLTSKEVAWCSSFSQNIPDLAERSSERLVRLLADDYKKRFENKKKYNKNISISVVKKSKKKR